MRILWKWIMHSVLIEEQNILDWRILQFEIHKLCIPLVMWWMMQWRIIISQIWSRGIISEKSYLVGPVNKKIFRNISQNLWDWNGWWGFYECAIRWDCFWFQKKCNDRYYQCDAHFGKMETEKKNWLRQKGERHFWIKIQKCFFKGKSLARETELSLT